MIGHVLLIRPDTEPMGGDGSAAVPARLRPRAIPELLLVAGLFLIYKLGRIAAEGHVAEAFGNARHVWSAERWLHLPNEVDLQRALLSSLDFVRAANVYYAYVHFPATIAVLLWLYIRRPAHYVPIRRLMTVLTGFALLIHFAFPLAPPRMLSGDGLMDTASRYGPSVYGSPSTDTLSNQYAAMPSLHFGWALVIAIALIMTLRSRWRWLWLLYPAATAFVILGTANHYWLDCLAAGAIVGATMPFLSFPDRRSPTATTDAVVATVPAQRRAAATETLQPAMAGVRSAAGQTVAGRVGASPMTAAAEAAEVTAAAEVAIGGVAGIGEVAEIAGTRRRHRVRAHRQRPYRPE